MWMVLSVYILHIFFIVCIKRAANHMLWTSVLGGPPCRPTFKTLNVSLLQFQIKAEVSHVFSTLAWQRCEYNTTTTTSPNITTHGWMEICLSCTSAIAAWYAGLSFSSPRLRSVLHHVVIFTQIHSLIWYFLSHLSQINIQRCSVGKCVCVESSRVMFSELNKLGESGSLSLFQHKCNRMLISVTVRVSKRRIIGCV